MKNKKGFTLIELMIVIAIPVLLVWPLTWWTDRSMDWALSEWKHRIVHVPYWLAFIVTCVTNGFAIAFDVIVEILRRVQ